MKLLIDTNVILDTFLEREPHRKYADVIFDLIGDNKIVGYINTSSVTDIYYVLRKKLSDAESREKIRTLLTLFQTVDVTKTNCFAALDSPISDFEDALVAVCAQGAGVHFVVTRDDEFLKHHRTISPSDFLEKFNKPKH